MQYLVAGALGLGLAASSGFRVFVPLLAASVAYHTGYMAPSAGFAWLGTWAALLTLATATVVEIVGYYVPFVDHLLDTITTPASFVAGTILMTSALPHLDPTLRWTLGILVGGGTAGLVQTGTALLRGASTATTGGLGNPVGLIPAAIIVLMLPEKLQFIQEYRFLLFASVVIVILLFRPQGLLPRKTRLFFRRKDAP